MAQNTLIIICKNNEDAEIASRLIDRRRDTDRFFILLDQKPSTNFFTPQDITLCLDRILEFSSNAEEVCIRAGLMYAPGWNLLFCLGDNLPSEKEITDMIDYLKKDEQYLRTEKIWGVTREYIVLYGLPDLYSESQIPDNKEDGVSDPIMVSKILIGAEKEANEATILQALKEVVPLSKVSDEAIRKSSSLESKFLLKLSNFALKKDEQFPDSILIDGKASPEDLTRCLKNVQSTGVVVVATTEPKNYTSLFTPFRHFRTTSGIDILLFQGQD